MTEKEREREMRGERKTLVTSAWQTQRGDVSALSTQTGRDQVTLPVTL